jgi:hypothetical protein
VNDKILTVSMTEDGYARVDRADLEYPYCAVSPASIYGGTVSEGELTVSIPSTYTYATTSSGKQNLQTPMSAYAASGSNQLKFYHLTAALIVHVQNDFGIDVEVTSIVVSSETNKLCGNLTYSMRANGVFVRTATASSDAEKSVTMNFPTNSLVLASGQSKDVMIPVLPVTNNQFTIVVNARSTSDPSATYQFNRKQGHPSNLDRTDMGYAPAVFGGRFSVSSGTVVRFSPGNLQYQASTSTWRFAPNQYDVCWNDNANIASDYSGWIDLFGWGATGYYTQPYHTSTEYGDYKVHYVSDDMYGAYADGDWGHNAISNGGNATNLWRTLSSTEWDYLLNSRPGVSYSASVDVTDARYSYVKVADINGIMLFPDEFDGAGLRSLLPTNVNNALPWGVGKEYSAAEWKLMEMRGCVFIPVAGWRNGPTFNGNQYGRYWTGNVNGQYAVSVNFQSNVNVEITSSNRFNGYSVRLVRK